MHKSLRERLASFIHEAVRGEMMGDDDAVGLA